MSINIRYPNITGKTDAEQLTQIKSYLYQLVQQLNWVLSNLEAGTGSASASGVDPSFGDISAETFYELKSLLIQSSDTLNAYYDKINQKLEGQYVTQAVFEEYQKSVAKDFKDLGEQYVSQETFDQFTQENSENIADLDNRFVLQTDFDAYKQEVSQRFDTLQQSIDELQQRIDAMQETGGE